MEVVVVPVELVVVMRMQCSDPSLRAARGPTTDQSSQYPSFGVNTNDAHAGLPLHSAMHNPIVYPTSSVRPLERITSAVPAITLLGMQMNSSEIVVEVAVVLVSVTVVGVEHLLLSASQLKVQHW